MARAGRPKKESIKLPEWFDIQKYRSADDFDSYEWLLHLSVRRQLLMEAAKKKKQAKGFQEILLFTRSTPTSMPEGEGVFSFLSDPVCGFVFPRQNAVELANNFNINEAYGNFPAAVVDFLDEDKCVMVNEDGEELIMPSESEDEAVTWLMMEAALQDGVLIKIDLNRPDKILLDEFEALLNEIRTQRDIQKPKTQYRSVDFKRWFKSGVLPYMDLRIWEVEQGGAFHRPSFIAAMEELLGETLGDGVLKTAKSQARKISSIEFLELLAHQASREARGLRKESRKFQA
jgi:hypothetical protein